ncbi:hypothetical protein AB0085_27460, partial [Klebsiella pneumoniae]
DLLFQNISRVADDGGVPEEWLPLMLLHLPMTTRAMAYATSVAKPSAGGLKLDLDRFRRDFRSGYTLLPRSHTLRQRRNHFAATSPLRNAPAGNA